MVNFKGLTPPQVELGDANGHEFSQVVQGLPEAHVDLLGGHAAGQVVGKVGRVQVDAHDQGREAKSDFLDLHDGVSCLAGYLLRKQRDQEQETREIKEKEVERKTCQRPPAVYVCLGFALRFSLCSGQELLTQRVTMCN